MRKRERWWLVSVTIRALSLEERGCILLYDTPLKQQQQHFLLELLPLMSRKVMIVQEEVEEEVHQVVCSRPSCAESRCRRLLWQRGELRIRWLRSGRLGHRLVLRESRLWTSIVSNEICWTWFMVRSLMNKALGHIEREKSEGHTCEKACYDWIPWIFLLPTLEVR